MRLWVGVRTLLLHNEETRLKTGKSAVRTGGRVNALYDISEESRAQGVQIQAMSFMQEQQRLLTMQEASFRDGMDREAMYNRDEYEWRLGNARDCQHMRVGHVMCVRNFLTPYHTIRPAFCGWVTGLLRATAGAAASRAIVFQIASASQALRSELASTSSEKYTRYTVVSSWSL